MNGTKLNKKMQLFFKIMQIYSLRPSFPTPFLPPPENCPFLYLKTGKSLTYTIGKTLTYTTGETLTCFGVLKAAFLGSLGKGQKRAGASC